MSLYLVPLEGALCCITEESRSAEVSFAGIPLAASSALAIAVASPALLFETARPARYCPYRIWSLAEAVPFTASLTFSQMILIASTAFMSVISQDSLQTSDSTEDAMSASEETAKSFDEAKISESQMTASASALTSKHSIFLRCASSSSITS